METTINISYISAIIETKNKGAQHYNSIYILNKYFVKLLYTFFMVIKPMRRLPVYYYSQTNDKFFEIKNLKKIRRFVKQMAILFEASRCN